MAAVDTDVLIIGAGPSGLGLAIQLRRKLGVDNIRIIEKSDGVGGTWRANTYPGCGCDVMSHFYSFSFALKSDWTRMYSMQPEIQSYFEALAREFQLYPKISFGTSVESAVWQSSEQRWLVSVTNHSQKTKYTITARALVSSVGSLSVPKPCSIPGADSFEGKIFHSAQWDNSLNWTDKAVVVVGNGCSATQFVPVMTRSVRQIVQFSRQAHYLAERDNQYYSDTFKRVMRYIPLAMRLYRFSIYASMESDFAGFHITGGQRIRDDLARDNEAYVKKTAPSKYWDFLIPRHQIGCKRKVLDTDYLACLWRDNMELVPDDPIAHIESTGVRTRSGRLVLADAIVLATGFETHRLLFPMKIVGEAGLDLEQHWKVHSAGSPAAYLGTVTPGFPNFFTLMGPNTLTGHSSVIFTSECQILLTLGLLRPILSRSLLLASPVAVSVTPAAGARDVELTRRRLKDYVWSAGCTSWALDPESGTNIAMYHHYQWHYYLRCLFLKRGDFEYRYAGGMAGKMVVGFGWVYLERAVLAALMLGGAVWGARTRPDVVREGWEWVLTVLRSVKGSVVGVLGGT
ncbi:FAD/NAD(P)-binding domain-containing protein [Myriangium duriaei CBS 260.36]|uniref:FAD/NAD(P)-binding domain-containing protein n=1 Tax=Myriangium duriaei CBS 260.36 TaxID=1168546 RepID=A0A9P4J6U0_9PEZI|nr:FAD/NAD(P)-binding domain-containing protein [Myriangium duriaei CBS 260.36]